MKINFSDEHIEHIYEIIKRYHNVNVEYDNCKRQAKILEEKTNELKSTLDDIKKEECDFMEELHKIYGEFSLQDISDSLNIQ